MSTELLVINPDDFKTAGEILVQNRGYVSDYKKTADKIKSDLKDQGPKLTPEQDARLNKYLVSAKTGLKKMEDDRKPITSKIQEIVKCYTAEENALKVVYGEIQALRDASAKAWAIEDQEQRRKDQLKLDQEKERITLFAEAESQIRSGYAAQLTGDKSQLLRALEGASVETIDAVEELLTNATGNYTDEMFKTILPNITPQFITVDEGAEIMVKATAGKLDKIRPHYEGEIRAYANHLLSLIPARREEIEAGQESKAAAELRETEAAQQAEQAKVAEAAKEAAVSQGITNAVMNININQTARTSMMPSSKPIESYSIAVTKREGWAEIFKFYFTHSDEVDLGKIKMEQMKTFAERLAKSQNIKIESDAIVYEAKYKAVAKKVA